MYNCYQTTVVAETDTINVRHDICPFFTLSDFQSKNFTLIKCIICDIVHSGSQRCGTPDRI